MKTLKKICEILVMIIGSPIILLVAFVLLCSSAGVSLYETIAEWFD